MPMWSGAMQRPSGCRCGMTFRHRYDEVGLPCSSTMGSPSPTSTYAISLPRTCRRCFWYGNAAEIMFTSPLIQCTQWPRERPRGSVVYAAANHLFVFAMSGRHDEGLRNQPGQHRPASGRIMSRPNVAIHRVARPSLGKPVVSPLWGHERSIIWQTRASIFVSIRPVRQAVGGRPVLAHSGPPLRRRRVGCDPTILVA